MPTILQAMRAATALILPLLLATCAEPPVRWSPSAAAPSAPTADMHLAIDTGGGIQWVAPEPLPPGIAAAAAACPGSVRVARAGASEVYAVWWEPRTDSSAALLAARSADGGRSWPDRAPVDTADRGVNGCRRPPAAVVADSATGYVHVAYALVAPGGTPGIFYAHSMPGHFLFHAPVPIVYGERPGRTSVAASGDVVAVAYEDPNSKDPRVGLAISRTLGHTFDHRVAASTGIGAAVDPRVALAGATVAVAWRQRQGARGMPDGAAATGSVMVRLGELSGP